MKKRIIFQLKHFENLTYDQLIIEILKQTNISLPLNFISKISGISKDRTCRVVNSLEKYGLVKKTTAQKAAFYSLKKAKKKG